MSYKTSFDYFRRADTALGLKVKRTTSYSNSTSYYGYFGAGTRHAANYGGYANNNNNNNPSTVQSRISKIVEGTDKCDLFKDFTNDNKVPLLPPIDMHSDKIPQIFELYLDIQHKFAEYDSNDEETTNFLLQFIENNPLLGLREFEINVFIHPKRVKHYVQLYSLLSKNVRLLATNTFHATQQFEYYMIKNKCGSFFESKLITTYDSEYYLQKVFKVIFPELPISTKFSVLPHEYIDAIIDDDDNFFIQESAKVEFDINARYMYEKCFVTLVELMCFYGAIKCFRYIYQNYPDLNLPYPTFALAGGNLEIFRLLEQKQVDFSKCNSLPLLFRNDDLFTYLIHNEDEKSLEFTLTETYSINAIFALAQRNHLINVSDLLEILVSDGINEMSREIAKISVCTIKCFQICQDVETLNTLIDNMSPQYLKTIFEFTVECRDDFHTLVIIGHPKFDQIQIDKRYLEIIQTSMPEVHEVFLNKSTTDFTPEQCYKLFIGNKPLSYAAIIKAIKHAISINNFDSLDKLCKQASNWISNEQIKEIALLSPYVWNYLAQRYFKNAFSREDIIFFVANNGILNETLKIPIEKFINFNTFKDSIAFDFNFAETLNFLYFSKGCSQFMDVMTVKGLIQRSVWRSISATVVELTSNKDFENFINEHYELFATTLCFSPDLVKYFYGKKISKAVFDKILHIYMYFVKYNQESTNVLQILTDPVNKEHIDIEKMCDDVDFIKYLDFTKEQYEFLQSHKFPPSALITNIKNAQFITIEDIDKLNEQSMTKVAENIEHIPQLLPYINTNKKLNVYIPYMTSSKVACKLIETKYLIKALPNNWMSSASLTNALEELSSRNMTPKQMFKIAVMLPNREAVTNYLKANAAKFNENILIIYSALNSLNIVPKTSTIDAFFFIELICTTKAKLLRKTEIFQYQIAPRTVLAALHIAIAKGDFHALKLLHEKGASFEAIYENKIALQCAKSCRNESEIFNYIADRTNSTEYRLRPIIVKPYEMQRYYQKTKLNHEYDLIYDFNKLCIYHNFSSQALNDVKSVFSKEVSLVQALMDILTMTPRFNEIVKQFLPPVELNTKSNDEIEKLIDLEIANATKSYKNVFSVLSGKDMIVKDSTNSTLLYLATRIGKIEIIESLLNNGADVNYCEGFFFIHSPALHAISKNRADILNLFISKGLNINLVYSSDDFTLLNAAIEYNSLDCFRILVNHESCSLVHKVTLSPMSAALIQYAKGNKDYANILKPKINAQIERVESDAFIEFEDYLKKGQGEYVYHGPQRKADYERIGEENSIINYTLLDIVLKTDYVQKNLILHMTKPYLNRNYFPVKEEKEEIEHYSGYGVKQDDHNQRQDDFISYYSRK